VTAGGGENKRLQKYVMPPSTEGVKNRNAETITIDGKGAKNRLNKDETRLHNRQETSPHMTGKQAQATSKIWKKIKHGNL